MSQTSSFHSTAGSRQSYVVHFTEGNGYVLVKPLSHGTQGEVYLVRSLTDGKLYVRKHSRYGAPDPDRTPFKHLLPSFAAPAVVETIRQGRAGDVLYYTFCNGGDLSQLIARWRRNNIHIPEALYWSYISQMIRIFAFIHAGWTSTGIQQDWEHIEHGDAFPQNVFLDWSDDDELFPSFVLGDWDLDGFLKDRAVRSGRNLAHLQSTLEEFNWETPRRKPNAAYEAYMSLRKEASKATMGSGNKNVVVAQYIAERFLPLAAQNIARLQAETVVDYRSLRVPAADVGYTIFTGERGSDEPDDDEFRKWIKTKNASRDLRETW